MPFDQERRDYLNEKYPSAGHPRTYEQEFRNNTIDRQVDGLMKDALNLKRFNDNKLMVPSDAELQYRANVPAPTNPDVIIPREPLSEGLLKRDRPNPTPPTDKPKPIPNTPRTSPASPRVTPRTSGGGGNAIDMQVAPPTAAPRQSIGGPNPAPGAKPSGLPGPAGRLAYPAAGAAIDFAFRLGSGQPLGQAAAGSAGSLVGSIGLGAAALALSGGNPVAGYLGGMVGGYLGGMAGSALYNLAFPPTAEAPKDLLDPKTGPLPFTGGQQCNQSYYVWFKLSYQNNPDPSERRLNPRTGKVLGVVTSKSLSGNTLFRIEFERCDKSRYYENVLSTPDSNASATITRVERVDGQPDTEGNPPPLPITQDRRTPDSVMHPGNTNFAPSSAAPIVINNNQTNITNAPNLAPNNYAPGGFKNKSDGNARGDSPDWIPKATPKDVPHPNYSPIPVAGLPGAAPSGSPSSTGAPAPSQAGSPNRSPFSFSPDGTLTIVTPGSPSTTGNPKTNPADQTFPGSLLPNPLTANPLSPGQNFNNSPSPDTGTPSGLPTTVVNQPTPDAYRDTPVVPAPTPTPTTPTTPTTSSPEFDEFKKRFDEQALLLVGLTSLLNPIANNTTPEALRDAAATGTCQTLQPGGCMAPLAQNAQNAANNSANNSSALAGLMAFLQALQATFLQPILAGVNLINTKLGPVMAGVDGIGGFLSRLSKSLGVDRALNLIAIASNLHNAMMLSSNLKVTLLEMLSSVGNATGLLQTSENENVDLNAVFNRGIETFLISILGVESYAGLKVGLRKYNAIYQAAANSLNAVSSMFNSLGNVVEQGAEYSGKIGNALKGAGQVAENAYQWMSEKFDAKTSKFIKFQSTVGDVTQVLETINEIAESVVEGQQAATEFQKANTEFIKAVEDAKKNPGIENKAVKEEAAKAKENATKDPTGELEEGLLSFLTN